MGRKLRNDELGRMDITAYKSASKTPLTVVLDNVRSLHNVGSVFRTADAFRIAKIYLCGITGTPPHKDIHKTALGATESVDWAYEKDILSLLVRLKKQGHVILSVEQAQGSISLEKYTPEKNRATVLIFGNEVKGVSQEVIDLSDAVLEIPQWGTKHSLNISVSTGIVLWELIRKMKFPEI